MPARTRARLLLVVGLLIAIAALAGITPFLVRSRHVLQPLTRVAVPMATREQQARALFLRTHRGAPLNVSIGKAARELHDARPMGKFVLGLGWNDRGNDCSDFVKCAVDEGTGLQARFRRRSERHLVGDSYRYQYGFWWDHKLPLLPGDCVSVRHSPWYKPYPGACWHVGILGDDGNVYDFVKLRSWRQARYGRNPLSWFVRHAPRQEDVYVRRLLPEYRYRLWDLKGDVVGESRLVGARTGANVDLQRRTDYNVCLYRHTWRYLQWQPHSRQRSAKSVSTSVLTCIRSDRWMKPLDKQA